MITQLSLQKQIDLINKKEIKIEELFQEYLSNIDKLNPQLNAIVSLRDRDWIIKKAQEQDSLKQDIKIKQILFGLPIATKELFDVKELPTTYGIPEYQNEFPESDSLIIKNLKQQGATIIGKSNMAELAIGSHTKNKLFKSTSNPYNLSLSPGGSSGGASAAVASCLIPFSDGTDMMGSCRNPAAYTNLYGFRPSPGLIPDKRGESKYPVLTTPGGIARTPEDLSIFLDSVSGIDDEDYYSYSFEGSFRSIETHLNSEIKIGWLSNFVENYTFEKGIIELCEIALNQFASAEKKISIERCNINIDPNKLWEVWCNLRSKITFDDLSSMRIQNFEELGFPVKWEYEQGEKIKEADISNAIDHYLKDRSYVDSLFDKYDFLALPSAQLFPFDKEIDFPKNIQETQMDTYHRWMEVTVFASMFQLPTISVPVGFNEKGLPMGMQLIGKNKSDEKVIHIGKYYEEIFNRSKIQPNIINELQAN